MYGQKETSEKNEINKIGEIIINNFGKGRAVLPAENKSIRNMTEKSGKTCEKYNKSMKNTATAINKKQNY